MKHTLLTILAATVAVVSCNSIDGGDGLRQAIDGNTEYGDAYISVSQGSIITKSATESDNNKINHLQVFVFDKTGSLVASRGKDLTSTATSTTPSDTLKVQVPLKVSGMAVYCVANAKAESSQWASVKTVSDLKACTSNLSSNAADYMSMIGSVSDTIFTKDAILSVPVKRFGCKVILSKVTTAFASAGLAAEDFTLTDIFLTNVQPTCPYSMTATNGAAAGWYNKRGLDGGTAAGVKALIAETGLSTSIKSGLAAAHYFYCYPNTIKKAQDSHDHSGSFTARRTRLVLKTTLGEATYYYPVTLPGSDDKTLESNKTYTITDLKITGIGVDHPEDEILKGSIAANITVKDWETGEEWSVEL